MVSKKEVLKSELELAREQLAEAARTVETSRRIVDNLLGGEAEEALRNDPELPNGTVCQLVQGVIPYRIKGTTAGRLVTVYRRDNDENLGWEREFVVYYVGAPESLFAVRRINLKPIQVDSDPETHIPESVQIESQVTVHLTLAEFTQYGLRIDEIHKGVTRWILMDRKPYRVPGEMALLWLPLETKAPHLFKSDALSAMLPAEMMMFLEHNDAGNELAATNALEEACLKYIAARRRAS